MDEDFDIIHAVSTGASLSDLITTLSSLECLRACLVGRDIIDLKPDSDVAIRATLSNAYGHMEVSIWVKWRELAPLICADMLQKNSVTQTTADMVADILSSRACPSSEGA